MELRLDKAPNDTRTAKFLQLKVPRHSSTFSPAKRMAAISRTICFSRCCWVGFECEHASDIGTTCLECLSRLGHVCVAMKFCMLQDSAGPGFHNFCGFKYIHKPAIHCVRTKAAAGPSKIACHAFPRLSCYWYIVFTIVNCCMQEGYESCFSVRLAGNQVQAVLPNASHNFIVRTGSIIQRANCKHTLKRNGLCSGPLRQSIKGKRAAHVLSFELSGPPLACIPVAPPQLVLVKALQALRKALPRGRRGCLGQVVLPAVKENQHRWIKMGSCSRSLSSASGLPNPRAREARQRMWHVCLYFEIAKRHSGHGCHMVSKLLHMTWVATMKSRVSGPANARRAD